MKPIPSGKERKRREKRSREIYDQMCREALIQFSRPQILLEEEHRVLRNPSLGESTLYLIMLFVISVIVGFTMSLLVFK